VVDARADAAGQHDVGFPSVQRVAGGDHRAQRAGRRGPVQVVKIRAAGRRRRWQADLVAYPSADAGHARLRRVRDDHADPGWSDAPCFRDVRERRRGDLSRQQSLCGKTVGCLNGRPVSRRAVAI
jgi:hypothetical protein